MASEAEIIFNRANVALARSQRLIASWLPPKTQDELANEKTEEELQREEDEIFTAVPEKLGLGAPLPKSQADGSWNRAELSSNDKLRKQLLGKNAKAAAPSRIPGSKQPYAKQTNNNPSETQPADSGSEEESRSSLATRGKKKTARTLNTPSSADTETGTGTGSGAKGGSGKKRPGSYLDEILSKRSKKKAVKKGGD